MMSRKRTIADTIALCLLIGLVLPMTWLSAVKAGTVNFQFQVKVVKTDFSGWADIMVEVWDGSSKIATGKTDSNGDVYLDLPPGGPYEFRAGDASTTALVGSVPSAALVGVILMPLTVEYPVLDTTAPVVTITAPANGAYYKPTAVPVGAFTVVELNPYTVVEAGWSTDEGVQTYAVTATDSAGNVGSASRSYTVDNTPPVVTITVPVQGAEYTLGQTVLAYWTATDALSGIASAEGTVPSESLIDTATVGTKTFTVTATDNAGNTVTETVTYEVIYGFSGLLPPYLNRQTVKIGSALPLKWQYTDSGGNVVNSPSANPTISITFGGSQILVKYPGNSDLRYNSDSNMWNFNWKTTGLQPGIYWIWITSAQTGQVNGPFLIQLR